MARALKEVKRPSDISADEWDTRIELAACYRLVHKMGWADHIATHISARVPGPEDHFLLNPYGMMFDEITASSLVKIDVDGNIIGESNGYSVNPAGFVIHSAVHMAKPELLCALHTHTYAGVGISCQEGGLLPLSQMQLVIWHELAYHDYEGAAETLDERERIVADLGDRHMLILRNHGLMTVGETVGAAFVHMFKLERACRMQLHAQQAGAPLIELSDAVVNKTADQGKRFTSNTGHRPVGGPEWDAFKRLLDREDQGYKM